MVTTVRRGNRLAPGIQCSSTSGLLAGRPAGGPVRRVRSRGLRGGPVRAAGVRLTERAKTEPGPARRCAETPGRTAEPVAFYEPLETEQEVFFTANGRNSRLARTRTIHAHTHGHTHARHPCERTTTGHRSKPLLPVHKNQRHPRPATGSRSSNP